MRNTLNGESEDPHEWGRRTADDITAELLRDLGFPLGSQARNPERHIMPIGPYVGAPLLDSLSIHRYPSPIAFDN